MKKQISRILSAIIVCCVLISAVSFTVFADSYLGVSGSSGTVGGTVNVNLSISGDISGYQAVITYDSSAMEFSHASGGVQLSANGAGGAVSIVDYQNGTNTGPMSCTLVFTAKKAGTYTVGVSNFYATDGNGDGVASSGGSGTVTINAPVTASSDATLKSLTISPGSLSPSFSSGTTQYSATVSSGTTRLTVSATPNHSEASVYVSGAGSLSVGQNNVYVTVTAEDGTQKTYTIVVTRNSSSTTKPDDPDEPEVPDEPEEKEVFATLENGSSLKITPTIDPDLVPKGFTITEKTIDDVTVQALTYGEGFPLVLYLEGNSSSPTGFYFYNEETGICTPMTNVTSPEFTFIPLDQESANPPEGYVLGTFKIGDTEYAAYVPNGVDEPDHCLIYGMNSGGLAGFYIYDPVDGTFQRYRFEDTSGIVYTDPKDDEDEKLPSDENTVEKPLTLYEKISNFFTDSQTKWIALGTGALILVLLILAVIFIVLYAKKASAMRRSYAVEEDSHKDENYSSGYSYEPPVIDENIFEPIARQENIELLNSDEKQEMQTETPNMSTTGDNMEIEEHEVTPTTDTQRLNSEDIQFDIPDFGNFGSSIPVAGDDFPISENSHESSSGNSTGQTDNKEANVDTDK